MLQQYAQRSFEAGERLLGQAGREVGGDPGLQQAATRYAATLRSLGTPQRGDRTGAGDLAANSNQPPVGPVSGADLASIALINHAVKEAIGSLKIQQLTRSPGSTDSPAAQNLLTHAREMDNESRAMIQGIAGGTGSRGSAIVLALAQQASELVLAMQGLGAEPGLPAR